MTFRAYGLKYVLPRREVFIMTNPEVKPGLDSQSFKQGDTIIFGTNDSYRGIIKVLEHDNEKLPGPIVNISTSGEHRPRNIGGAVILLGGLDPETGEIDPCIRLGSTLAFAAIDEIGSPNLKFGPAISGTMLRMPEGSGIQSLK